MNIDELKSKLEQAIVEKAFLMTEIEAVETEIDELYIGHEIFSDEPEDWPKAGRDRFFQLEYDLCSMERELLKLNYDIQNLYYDIEQEEAKANGLL